MTKNYNLRRSKVRRMTNVEAAWIGAMIEAEGSVIVNKSHGNGKHAMKIYCTNTDPEIISALLRVTGVGTVCSKTWAEQWQKKPCYSWQVQAQNDAIDLASQCALYSMKLQKVQV